MWVKSLLICCKNGLFAKLVFKVPQDDVIRNVSLDQKNPQRKTSFLNQNLPNGIPAFTFS